MPLYFNALSLVCLLAAVPAAGQQVPGGMAERTAACIACHGQQGRPSGAGYLPRIAGKPQDYLYRQLLSLRDGGRVHAQMAYLLAPLSDAYLQEMAAYFAGQQLPYPAPPPASAPAPVLARGRQLVFEGDPARKVPACVACHGAQLAGVLPAIPGLLGLPRDYLNLQFGAWRNGVRRAVAPDCMAIVANRLTPADVAAVAAWLAGEKVPAAYAPAPAVPVPLPLACSGAQ